MDICLLSGLGLCYELITRPEESYRLWCVVLCDLEISWKKRPRPAWGRSAIGEKSNILQSLTVEFLWLNKIFWQWSASLAFWF